MTPADFWLGVDRAVVRMGSISVAQAMELAGKDGAGVCLVAYFAGGPICVDVRLGSSWASCSVEDFMRHAPALAGASLEPGRRAIRAAILESQRLPR